MRDEDIRRRQLLEDLDRDEREEFKKMVKTGIPVEEKVGITKEKFFQRHRDIVLGPNWNIQKP